MRILIAGISYAPQMNGQAVFTANLAEGLARLGHTVHVVFDSYRGHAFTDTLNGVEIEGIQPVDLTKVVDPLAYFSLFPMKNVRRAFDVFRPDVVHIQDHYPVSLAALKLAHQRGIKVLGSNHFMPENLAGFVPWLSFFKPVFQWAMWQWMLNAFNRVDAATAQSRAAAALIQAHGLKVPVSTISCGIDLKRFYPNPAVDRKLYLERYGLDPQRKIFMFIGRVDREKRIGVLLHAMHLLKRQDVQLAVAGRGFAAQELQALCSALHLGDRVHFTGFIPPEDLPALLNSADVFTMPSEAELLSIATLEALACAKPVLLANAVALPEWVKNGVNGYLFKPGDPEDAARCINLLADQAGRWPEMGRASLEIARGHGLDEIVRKFENQYEALLSARQASPQVRKPVTHAVKPQ